MNINYTINHDMPFYYYYCNLPSNQLNQLHCHQL